MKRHLELVPDLSPEERTEARRRAVIGDWWDASAEPERAGITPPGDCWPDLVVGYLLSGRKGRPGKQ